MTERVLAQLQLTLTAQEPIEALGALTALRAELDEFERRQVRAALDGGATFTDIARAIGISRQAAHRRYRRLPGAADAPPRISISPEARDVLRLARLEAMRVGSPEIDGVHVALALAGRDGTRAAARSARVGAVPPARLGRGLHAALTAVEGRVEIEDLLRAASAQPAGRRILGAGYVPQNVR